ncbi:MAG: cytochrome c biogenesis protein CcsA [Armatimonadota bacterium]|nr:cytochrome c biogenesis protein CcsA [Armatimonadota bacterium]
MPSSTVLIELSGVIFGLAGLLYMWQVFAHESVSRAVSSFPFVGVIILSLGLVSRTFEIHQLPFTSLSGALAFTVLSLAIIYLALEQRRRIGVLGTFVFAMTAIAVFISVLLPQQISLIPFPTPVNLWCIIHLGASFLAYASLSLAFWAAIIYMLQAHMLKRKRITHLQKHLPSLGVMDDLAYRMVTFGFLLLTVAIISDVLWAKATLRKLLDPNRTWLVVIWLVYAAYLHVRVVRGWQGKWSNRLLIIGFVCILAGFLSILVSYLGADSPYLNLGRFNW